MSDSNNCVHCGADCGKIPVVWNSLKFCCNGCKQVYQLLNENKLYKYYTIEDTPGIRVDAAVHGSKYEYLEKEEVKEKIYLFHENNIAKVRFYIPAIHCASCIWLLENLNTLNPGIKYSSVNFIKKELTASFNIDEISLRELVELLASIHYIPDISLKSLDKKEEKGVSKLLLYKIGVAGFVFGNVMLYSLPEYFNGQPLGESLGKSLYYLSYILTIPLVFFSGSDYLISAFKNLIKGIVNIDLPIAIGILSLFGVTSYDVLSGTGPGYSDSLSGFLFFLLLGKWYQGKTYQALAFDRDYKSYFPVAVTRIGSEGEHSALLDEVSRGDKLLIRNNELIPADSIVIDGKALIDYSFVTGESTLVEKFAGDFLYAGGVQSGGAISIKVEKEIMQSHLTSLWNQSPYENKRGDRLKSVIDKVSVYFTIIIILLALSGFTWWIIKDSLTSAMLVLTSVLIVACPCALALTLPFTFGNVMRMLGLNGMYIKNSAVIESVVGIDTIVFDKTGTLTIPVESNIKFIGESLSDLDLQCAVSLAKQSTHPLSNALGAKYNDIRTLETEGYVEVAGRGIYATVNNRAIKLGSCEYISGKSGCPGENSSAVYLSIDDENKGFFEISNVYRDGFEDVVKKLGDKFSLYLLSGDNDTERGYLSEFFDSEKIHFEQKPQDKMKFIEDLQQNGSKVLMTGDGLNDAGAFIKSDVAMSVADDIYHFSPAGDSIIDAKRFSRLPAFIDYCKRSLRIVYISFAISFLYNIVGLSFALSGNLSPVIAAILMPVSSISVVAFATLSTRVLAKKVLS